MRYDDLVVTLDAPEIGDAQMYALLALHMTLAIGETLRRFNMPPTAADLKATFHEWEDGPPRVMMVFRVTFNGTYRTPAYGTYLLMHSCDDERWLWVDQHQPSNPVEAPTLDDFERMGWYSGLQAYYEMRATID